MATALTVVSNNTESAGTQIKRLQAEARALAAKQIIQFTRTITDLEEMASEIAEGGEAYPAGIRDIARRMAEDLEARGQTISAIAVRS